MGQTFDIKKVIKCYKLDTNEVAEALFPHVRYKMLALNRVLKGEAYLDTQQIEILAKLAGVLIQDLFTLGEWKGGREDNCIIMTHEDYKVKLNYNGVFMTLTKGPHIIAQEFTNTKNISVDDFISHIDSLINSKFNN